MCSVCRLIFMIHQSRWSVDCTRTKAGKWWMSKVRCASPGFFRHCCNCLESRRALRTAESPASHRNPQSEHSVQPNICDELQMTAGEEKVTWSGRLFLPPAWLAITPTVKIIILLPPLHSFQKALIYGSFDVTFVLFPLFEAYWILNENP